jgi:hypothetical protein
MSKYDKLLTQILCGNADANIPFDELRRLLQKIGFERESAVAITLFGKPMWSRKLTYNAMAIRPKLSSKAGAGGIAEIQTGR